MKLFSPITIFLSGILIGISIPACQQDSWKQEASVLMMTGTKLNEQRLLLDMQVDSLWDLTTTALASAIPVDFPPIDRNIFLKARNADHIRMFMSFKLLPESVQHQVIEAGKQDSLIALQIHLLAQEQDKFEKEKMAFLEKVNRRDQKEAKNYTELFRSIPQKL